MVTRVITNSIKAGCKEAYIQVSKEFCKVLMEKDGCIESKVYEVAGCDTKVVYIERWPDVETAEAVMQSETFKEFAPKLGQYYAGTEEMYLYETE